MVETVKLETPNSLEDIEAREICIFGAGRAGGLFLNYLWSKGKNVSVICDNKKNVWAKNEKYEICSPVKAIKMGCKYFVVGFMDNDLIRISDIEKELKQLGVKKENIFLWKIEKEWFEKFSFDFTQEYIAKSKEEYKINKDIESVVFLTAGYTEKDSNYIGGGAFGALTMQRKYLETSCGNIIKFYCFPEEIPFDMKFNKYSYITNTIYFLKKFLRQNPNVAFFVNDVFAGYALACLNSKYTLLYHGQGELLHEWNALERHVDKYEQLMIPEIEKIAFEKAADVYFPSMGARRYFLKTSKAEICIEQTEPLYNTIYDYPEKDEPHNSESRECLSVLSIGQLTELKGMDRMPAFLKRLSEIVKQNVRWVCVGSGLYHECIRKEIEELNKNSIYQIEYQNYKKVTHSRIYRLFDECDIYVMLHRVSIFDFSTLEAMYKRKAIILSDISGNSEYNVANNILLYTESMSDEQILSYIINREFFGQCNKEVYDTFFSERAFVSRYLMAISKMR